ncbi:hypothetical protein IJX73_04295 [bacterium]|nr:hypothetical protein [bacterium]
MKITPIIASTPFRGKINLNHSYYSAYEKPNVVDADKIVDISQYELLYKDSNGDIQSYKYRDMDIYGAMSEHTDYYARFLAAYAAAKVADPDVVIYA